MCLVSVPQFFQCRKDYNYYKYVNIKQVYCQNQRSFYSVKSYFVFWFEQKLYSFVRTTILWYMPSAQGQKNNLLYFILFQVIFPILQLLIVFVGFGGCLMDNWHFFLLKALFKFSSFSFLDSSGVFSTSSDKWNVTVICNLKIRQKKHVFKTVIYDVSWILPMKQLIF